MYIELGLLFIIYAFASASMLISIYALWTLKELQEFYKKKNTRSTTYRHPAPPITTKRQKGLWD